MVFKNTRVYCASCREDTLYACRRCWRREVLLDHLGKRWPLCLASAPPLEDVFVAARHIRILEVLLKLVAHHRHGWRRNLLVVLLNATAEEAAEEDLLAASVEGASVVELGDGKGCGSSGSRRLGGGSRSR